MPSKSFSFICLWLAVAFSACTTDHRPQTGVISTGNAGRIKVSLPASAQDSSKTGEFRFLQETDSIAEVRHACTVRLDSSCSQMLENGIYRVEIWVSSRIAGRTNWFEISGGAAKTIEVQQSAPITLHLEIQSDDPIDSVALGSRENAAQLVDGKWEVSQLADSSDALWVKVTSGGATTWKKYIQSFDGNAATVTPVSPNAPAVVPITTIVLNASNAPWLETTIIGAATPPGNRDDFVYATDTIRGLGAAWDESTIGRTLWRVELPDSLVRRSLRSAILVYQTANWGARGVGALASDYSVQGHRMLRPWKAGSAGYGTPNSSSIDGATPTSASWGTSWNKYLVGLDDSDAGTAVVVQGDLPALSLDPIKLDITSSVSGWLLDPTSNFGLVFHSPTEYSGTYPDYPVFWTSTARDPNNRPRLILVFSP